MRSVHEISAEMTVRLQSLAEMQRHKLHYFAQGWHMAWTGMPLFAEDIEAWEMGPVVADLWRDRKYGPLPDVSARPQLTELEDRTLTFVLARYGSYTGKALSDMTHAEGTAWHRVYHSRGQRRIDPVMIVGDFAGDPALDQAWFWSSSWMEGESEASKDIADGRTTGPMSGEDFLASL